MQATETPLRPAPVGAVAGAILTCALVAAAPWIATPWRVAPLLLAWTAALLTVQLAAGRAPRGFAMGRAVASHVVVTFAIAAWGAVLLAWPLTVLDAAPSLGASILVSVAGLVYLASLWRWWLLPALLLAAPTATWRAATTRSAAATREAETLFTLLPEGLAALLPILAALLLGGVLMPVAATATLCIAVAVLLLALAWFLARGAARAVAVVAEPLPMAPAATPDAPRGTSRMVLTAAETAPGAREEALLEAARDGAVDKALALLAAGADPAATPDDAAHDRRPLILLAAQLGDSRLLRALIARGVDIRATCCGLTPLHAATRDSFDGRPETVTALLTNGADPRALDADGATPLHGAALGTNVGIAALLLDAGADANALNRTGASPLAVACGAGNWGMATYLLAHGAHVDVARGEPALIAAAQVNDDDVTGVKLLLKQRAKVDARNALGRTALMAAALDDHPAIVTALLDARADVDAADQHGTTALMEAARAGANDVLLVLATQHPAVAARDLHGRDALSLACQSPRASVETVRTLLALGADPHAQPEGGRSALEYAVASGRWNLVAVLDPDVPLPASHSDDIAPEPGADSPAHLLDALRFGHWAAVSGFHQRVREWPVADVAALYLALADDSHREARQWLLDHGLDPEATLADGARLVDALMDRLPIAAEALEELWRAGASIAGAGLLTRALTALGDAAIGAALVPRLLDAGADPFGTDAAGRAPVHVAAANANGVALEALLARGCNPDVTDAAGRTPLHDALLGEHDNIVPVLRTLIRYGADPEAVAGNGETPLGMVLAANDNAAIGWLRWHGWPLPRRALAPADVPAAAATGDVEAVTRLLALGFDVDARDARGATALMRAAGGGHAAVATLLLARGADVAATSTAGGTALSAAVNTRHADIAGLLLEHGADANQRLPGGVTALLVAAVLGHAGLAAALLAHGADIKAIDDEGRTALHAAAQFCFASHDSLAARRILDVLLTGGAPVATRDHHGASALLFMLGGYAKPGADVDATHLGALLPLLLDAGVPINAADQRGVTALHCCAMHALAGLARVLLARGADRNARDTRGRTPEAVARVLGYVDVARELGPPVTVPGADSTLRQPS